MGFGLGLPRHSSWPKEVKTIRALLKTTEISVQEGIRLLEVSRIKPSAFFAAPVSFRGPNTIRSLTYCAR